MSQPRRPVVLVCGIVWIAAVAAGLFGLQLYESNPGVSAAAPARWPPDCPLTREPGRPVLLMFAHPRCPCTAASIDELAHLMTHCQGRVKVHVLFVRPPGTPEGWEKAARWHQAAAIPGVHVAADIEAAEARRFGAATSGQVLLFGPDGQRLYSGGITAARGHAGGNLGRQAVLALIRGETAQPAQFPVFGCALD